MVFFWSWGASGAPHAPRGVAYAEETPPTGGVLKVAIVGEPPSLDIPLTTATLTYYEDVGTVKLGDYFTLDVARRELRGDFRTAPRMYFWNTWLAK